MHYLNSRRVLRKNIYRYRWTLPIDENENKYFLTIQCELTKFLEAYCLKNKEAGTVASRFVEELVLRLGIPRAVATDMGTEFTANVFSQVCKKLGIKNILTTPYHHQSVGALENTHRQLGSYLKIMTSKCSNDWSNWVPYWTFSHNNTVNSTTGYAPAELVFGRLNNLPSDLETTIDHMYNFDSYVNEFKYRLQTAWKDAKESLL